MRIDTRVDGDSRTSDRTVKFNDEIMLGIVDIGRESATEGLTRFINRNFFPYADDVG